MQFNDIREVVDYIEVALGDFSSDYDVERFARDITEWKNGKLVMVIEDYRFFEIAKRYEK